MRAQRGGAPYDVEYRVVRPTARCASQSRDDVTTDESDRLRRMLGTFQDITERKRVENGAREREQCSRQVQMGLAHVIRVTTMGQLTASITHEVNQPIAAAATSADAGLRWLAAQPPNLERVRDALRLNVASSIPSITTPCRHRACPGDPAKEGTVLA
jgi:C4-dicarboxylate-specific signal transduction histidine kinase